MVSLTPGPLNPVTVFAVAPDGSVGNVLDGSFNFQLGFPVSKTEDFAGSATGDDLFTVTGKVMVTLVTGEVTNAIGSGVNDYKLRIKTDNVDLCLATDISSDAIGTMYVVSGQALAPLNGAATPAVKVARLTAEHDSTVDRTPALAPMIVGLSGGSCTIQSLHTAGDSTDAIDWILYYWPLEANAVVAAA